MPPARPLQPDGSPRVFSATALRRLDRLALERYAIPTIVLMEQAASRLAEVVRTLRERGGFRSVLILAGPGHNGADGLALARLLGSDGLARRIILAGTPAKLAPLARTHARIARALGLPIIALPESCTPAGASRALAASLARLPGPVLLVDALLGTGLNRPLDPAGTIARLITAANQARAVGAIDFTLAVDIPTGLHADTGRPLLPTPRGPSAIIADLTVSFVGLKRGFLKPAARAFVGQVVVADIAAPPALVKRLGRRPARPAPRARPARIRSS